jgi:hypothetical protein
LGFKEKVNCAERNTISAMKIYRSEFIVYRRNSLSGLETSNLNNNILE